MRKAILFVVLVVTWLLAVILVAMNLSAPAVVYAKRRSISSASGVAIGDYDNDGSNDLAISQWYTSGDVETCRFRA